MAGYGVRCLAARLLLDPSAVYHWIGGANQPRAAVAFEICELARQSGIDLTFEEIYSHSRKSKDSKTRSTDQQAA